MSLAADGAAGTIIGLPAGVALQFGAWGAEAGATSIDIGQAVATGKPDWVALGLDGLGFLPIVGGAFSGSKALLEGSKLIDALVKLTKTDSKLLEVIDKFSSYGGIGWGVRAYLADCIGIGPKVLDG